MCIKIIGEEEVEFNIDRPLMEQINGAEEIRVNYDPTDPKINSFLTQIEYMAKNGMSLGADIKVNPNNMLDGLKFERRIDKIKKTFDINEVVKGLTKLHSKVDHGLSELSELCFGRNNE